MKKQVRDLLFNTSLDLKLSMVSKDEPSKFAVRSKNGRLGNILGLICGIPCLMLIFYALRDQGIYLLLAPVFCPVLATLGVLFGLSRHEKIFFRSQGKAIKSFQLLHFRREIAVALPKQGVVSVYKYFSRDFEGGGGRYMYCAEIQGINGFGFFTVENETRRDEFTRDLADYLHYEICNEGERPFLRSEFS